MTGLRTPVVVGLHPRSGASTVAAALHAHEGSEHDRTADVVCVGEHALSLALSLVTPPAPPRPVLAIAAGAVPGPPLPAMGSRFGAVVLIPHLACWAGVPAPSEEIAMLLGLPAEHLAPPLRAYAAALRAIAAAVVHSGQLARACAPLALCTLTAAPTRPAGRHPVLRSAPSRRLPLGRSPLAGSPLSGLLSDVPGDVPDDVLDDDAHEAAGFIATQQAG